MNDPTMEDHSEGGIGNSAAGLEKRREREAIGEEAGGEEAGEEAKSRVKEGAAGVAAEEDVPRVHVSLGHSVEHSAGVVHTRAARVHEEEIGLERRVGEEAAGYGVRVSLHSRAELGGGAAAVT